MALERTIIIDESVNPYLLRGNSYFTVLGFRTKDSLWWWYDKINDIYVLSEFVGQCIKGSASRFTTSVPPSDSHNNNLVWTDEDGYSLWYDGTQWVLSKRVGFDNFEYNDPDEGYVGSDWYSSSTLTGTYTARGDNHGDPSITLSYDEVEAWTCDEECGEYGPIGGASDTLIVGYAVYSDGQNEWCSCSKAGVVSENSLSTILGTAPSISYLPDGIDGEGWYIGGQDPLKGYWRNLGGDPDGTYSLIYTGEDTPPEPSTYSLALDRYVRDAGTAPKLSMYVGQIGVWL